MARALARRNIDAFLAGAAAVDEKTRSLPLKQNISLLIALMWYSAGGGKGTKYLMLTIIVLLLAMVAYCFIPIGGKPPLAIRLAARPGWRCSFVSNNQDGSVRGIECVRYPLKGGATNATRTK